MPRTHLTPAELQELHDLAAQWGKIIARRTGDDAIEFDMSALESIAQAAAAGLVEGTLQCLLQRQADALADRQPCPACGRLCPLAHEDRTVQVQGGVALPYHEPVCHCPDCRRDFSPPSARACALTATATPRPSSNRSSPRPPGSAPLPMPPSPWG